MRKIIITILFALLVTLSHSQQTILQRMTGAQVRAALNSNFDTLYVSSGHKVSKTLSRYSTIQGAINAASSGTAIMVESGSYNEQLTLKDGVDLYGVGNVTVFTNDNAHTTITANSDTIKISNINIEANLHCLTAVNSELVIDNCKLIGRISARDGGYISLDSSKVDMTDCKIVYGNILAVKHSTFNYIGKEMEVLWARFFTGSVFDISVDKWNIPNNRDRFQFLEMGVLNSHQSDINPATGSYSTKADPDYLDWVAENKTGDVKGVLQVKSFRTDGFKAFYLYQNSELTILNSTFYDPVTFRRVSGKINDNSKLTITNSSIGSVAIGYGDMLMKAYNSRFTYDQDYPVWDGVGSIYNTDHWIQSGGTHLFESQTPEWRNKEVMPTLIFSNCIIEFMGDDVLNGLVDTVALKNLGVNFDYKSDSEDLPIDPVHVKWETSHSYTTGQILAIQHPDSGVADSIAFYVINNYISSATVNQDFLDGNIRKLFGANKQSIGYYQQLYYEYTTTDGVWAWRTGFKLGTYHGGKWRNNGCSFYQSTLNLLMENTIVNEYMDVWNAGFTYPFPFWDGERSYTATFGIRAGRYSLKNIILNQVGEFGEIGGNFGISIFHNDSIPVNIAEIDGLKITGDHQLGIMINAGKVASNATYLKINDYTYSGKNVAYNNNNRFVNESTAIVGTLGKAYMSTYLRFDKNLQMNYTQRQLSANLTDNTPTDGEIDSATGLTPVTAGTGWKCVIKDTNGSSLLYLIESDGTNWQYTKLSIAN